jgi:hypothetical protein
MDADLQGQVPVSFDVIRNTIDLSSTRAQKLDPLAKFAGPPRDDDILVSSPQGEEVAETTISDMVQFRANNPAATVLKRHRSRWIRWELLLIHMTSRLLRDSKYRGFLISTRTKPRSVSSAPVRE